MNILLADDHDLVRDAISALLKNDDASIEVDTVENLPRVLEKLRQGERYDVIILDLKMPGMNGLAGIGKVQSLSKNVPIIIMSGNASKQDVHTALELGARGFVPKTLAGRSLVSAVKLVASGETYVPTDVLTGNRGETVEGLRAALTKREMEVLSQLRRGHSNKEIARLLEISEATVKLHVRSLSDKFEAKNRTDIVIQAIDAGIV
ncbi:MAG: response regulator transcription factor [Pseudomonadota bacterium]